MARALRPDFPDTVHHVWARGVDQRVIFVDDDDRRLFLRILSRAAASWDWQRLAHCLLGNHYHLLLSTPRAGLAGGMKLLNGYYAQHFNRRYARSGHLFQGRYGSRLIQTDAHLLATAQYIEMNPVAAGLCATPDDWPWMRTEPAVWKLLEDYYQR